MLKLIEFTTEQNYIDLFISLPSIIYYKDKNYRAESRREVADWLRRSHSCTDFLLQKNWLVLDSEKVVARGIGFINKLGNFGTIGFFECENSLEAVQILVSGAKEFCRGNGVTKIYAPMNGSIWCSYRIMTKGFEDYPFMGEPYNKPYYKEIFENCGFRVAKTWETQFVKEVSLTDKTAYIFQALEKVQHSKGISVRSLKNFGEDINIIHKIIMNSFVDFFAFHEINEETFRNIYGGLRLICDKQTVKIAYNDKNEPIGFGIALPDYRSKLGFLFKYAKRYIFLYLGTWQENGKSVYPQASTSIIMPIMKNLFSRRKEYICALMSENAKTRKFAPVYDKVHAYALFELEVTND